MMNKLETTSPKVLTGVLCNLSELKDGNSYGFDPFGTGKDSVFLFLEGQNIRAYFDICPHYGETSLAWKKNAYLTADKSNIFCSAHGALFEVASGKCIAGPCLGQSLQAIDVVVSKDGAVQLNMVRPA